MYPRSKITTTHCKLHLSYSLVSFCHVSLAHANNIHQLDLCYATNVVIAVISPNPRWSLYCLRWSSGRRRGQIMRSCGYSCWQLSRALILNQSSWTASEHPTRSWLMQWRKQKVRLCWLCTHHTYTLHYSTMYLISHHSDCGYTCTTA